MKKFFGFLLVALMAVVLISCGGTGDDTTLPNGGDDTTNPNHVHSYVETVTLEPTCTSFGKKVMKCSCGAIEGDEMPIPFAAHDAKDATCTEDSVCAVCGKVLVEKYGHLFVDTVVSEVSCTTDGVSKSTCNRCGLSNEIVIKAGHSIDNASTVVSDGKVSGKCTKCGNAVTLEEKNTLIKLDFDDENEFSKYPAFTVSKPDGMAYKDSMVQLGGPLWLKYSADTIPQDGKLLLSFDFKLSTEGYTHRGESIFSFVAGRSMWDWLIKYYQANGVISTANNGFNSSNSISVEIGEWYNFTGIIDTATNEISVYIDGVNIGTRPIPDHNDASYGGVFELRFFDGSTNGISNPYFDNFKFVELK